MITTSAGLVLFNLDRHGFSPKVYRQVFATEKFYERFPAKIAEYLVAGTSESSDFPIVIRGFSTADWEVFLRALLPPETLKGMGDQALESIFDYLNLKTDIAQVSLAPVKSSLASDRGVHAIFLLLGTQPECTLAQVTSMTLAVLQQGELIFCNPPQPFTSLLTPLVEFVLKSTTTFLPEQVVLASQIKTTAENDPRTRLQFYRQLMRLSPLIPMALLICILGLVVRSTRSWLQWWGIPLTVAGLTSMLLAFSSAPALGRILQHILILYLPVYLPKILLEYGSELASAMVRELLLPVLRQGGFVALTGGIMLLVSLFLKSGE